MKITGGQQGKSFNDRQLAGEVRGLALGHLKQVLDPKYKNKKFQRDVLLRLCGSILPRLNEVTGADGVPLILPATLINKNDTPSITGDSSTG